MSSNNSVFYWEKFIYCVIVGFQSKQELTLPLCVYFIHSWTWCWESLTYLHAQHALNCDLRLRCQRTTQAAERREKQPDC